MGSIVALNSVFSRYPRAQPLPLSVSGDNYRYRSSERCGNPINVPGVLSTFTTRTNFPAASV